MKKLSIFCLCLFSYVANAQNSKEWLANYQLDFVDFQSPATQIGEGHIYSVQTGVGFDFEFSMSNYEFIFTKNFNSKVSNEFKQDIATIIAPDSGIAHGLLRWANYEFDLSELYARKVRKKLYESKGAFSNSNFFLPIFSQIQKEHMLQRTEDMTKSDIGQNRDVIMQLQEKVNQEIELLANYCKTCKPQKKSR